MLKLQYSRQTIKANIKDDIEELAGVFSRFDRLDEEAKRDYLENSYAPKLVGIASNLNELGIHPFQYPPENFDPRYVQEYGGKWTGEIVDKADINQSLIDFLENYRIAQSPEARFVLYNSLLYLDGKEVDKFKQRKLEVKASGFNRLKNFLAGRQGPIFTVDTLAKLSEQPFDYLECPFDGSMDGFRSSTFAKGKKVWARLTREEFEEYMLKRTYNEALRLLDGRTWRHFSTEGWDQGDRHIVANLIGPPRVKGTYSDSTVERFEKWLGSRPIASNFIASARRTAVRTKTRRKGKWPDPPEWQEVEGERRSDWGSAIGKFVAHLWREFNYVMDH